MKFRKKPVVVEAVQWGRNTDEMESFLGEIARGRMCKTYDCWDCGDGQLHLLLQENVACKGDWVVRLNDKERTLYGISAEVMAFKPDIFEQTYERIEE